MNPYARFLDGRDPREVIAETPGSLAAIVGRLGVEGLRRKPAPGKWSASEILCHLADTEVVFAFRWKQALAEPYHVIQPFDQDAWAKPYVLLEGRVALATFTALRQWNLALLATVPPAGWAKKLTHPERGELTLQTQVETMAGHDINHLQQLEAIAGMRGVSGVGG
jgi:DinB superfamily